MSKKTLIIIAGPTAVGKTELSINIANYYNTSIISADSRQFYKELNIGTAKPNEKELNKAEHYFINNLSINDYYNVSKYENEVLELLKKLFVKSDIIILTGGSGLYIDAVCKGIDELPDPDIELRNSLQKEFEEKGLNSLLFQLKRLDPKYFSDVDLANPNRVIRALEIIYQTGKPYSYYRYNKQKEREFNIIKIGLNRDRELLYNRINKRVENMISDGLVDEVKSLLPYSHLNALNTVGYKEIFKYFSNDCTLSQSIENIKTNSRRYAKRQLTWLRRDNEITWFNPEEENKLINFLDSEIKNIN